MRQINRDTAVGVGCLIGIILGAVSGGWVGAITGAAAGSVITYFLISIYNSMAK